MLKKDLFKLFQGLNSVSGLKGVKFAYAVAKNLSKIKSEIELLEKPLEKYNLEKQAIAKEYFKKDKDGQYIIKNNQYEITDTVKLDEELKKHNDKYSKELKEYEELLEKESDVELHKIKQSDLPEEITAQQIESLLDIIE